MNTKNLGRELKKTIALIVVVLILSAANTYHKKATPFRDGETVCFVGNSITHLGYYNYIISLFYYTRYPDRKIIFYNQGVGGDVAPGVFHRLNRIVDLKPTSVTFMLGMNDAGNDHYFLKDEEKKKEISNELYNRYCQYMDSIIYAMHKKLPNTRVTLIEPSIYDETYKNERASAVGKNATIIRMGQRCEQLAKQNKYDFVDFNSPMLKITKEHQLQNPYFTLADDRIHPNWEGSLLMAYTFLKNQGVKEVVSAVNIDAKKSRIKGTDNCTVSNFTAKDNDISFNLKSKALPFPVLKKGYRDSSFIKALKYIPFEEELNKEIVKVVGLKGKYKLLIDDKEVGNYTACELSEGINLASNKLTPEYMQTEQVLALQEEKVKKEEIHRTIAWIYHNLLRKKGLDRTSAKNKLIEAVQKEKLNMKNWELRQLNLYLENFEKEAQLLEEIKSIQKQIYTINKPKEHHYLLRKI